MASQSTGAVTTCWKATCTICYDEIFLDAREEEDRPVCAVGCGHVYHMKCILRWITTNPTCPQCMLHLTAQSLQRIIVDVEKVLVPVAAGGSAVNTSATGRGPAGDSAGATAAINSTTSLPQSSTSASSSVTAEARAREIEELIEENRALTARVRTLEKRTKDMEEETQTLHFLVNEREQRDQNHTNSQPASAPSNRGTTTSPLRSSSFTSSYGAGPSTSFGHRTHSHFPIVHPSGHHAFHYPSSYGTPHHGPPFGYTNRRLRPASYGDNFNFTTAEEQWSFPNFNGIVAPLSTSPPPLQPPPSAPRRRLHSQQSTTSGSTGTHGTPRPTLTVTRSSSTTNLSTTVPIPTMGPIPASLRPLLPDEYAEHEEFLRTFGSQVQQASAEQAPQPSSSDSSPSVQQDSTSSSNQPSSIGAAVADPSSASNPTPGGAVSAAPWSSTQQQPPAPSSPMGFGYGRSGLYIPTSGEVTTSLNTSSPTLHTSASSGQASTMTTSIYTPPMARVNFSPAVDTPSVVLRQIYDSAWTGGVNAAPYQGGGPTTSGPISGFNQPTQDQLFLQSLLRPPTSTQGGNPFGFGQPAQLSQGGIPFGFRPEQSQQGGIPYGFGHPGQSQQGGVPYGSGQPQQGGVTFGSGQPGQPQQGVVPFGSGPPQGDVPFGSNQPEQRQ